jgi:hypothetical protein
MGPTKGVKLMAKSTLISTENVCVDVYGHLVVQVDVPVRAADFDIEAAVLEALAAGKAVAANPGNGLVLRNTGDIRRAISTAAGALWERLEARSEVIAEVAPDGTGVGSVALVYYEITGRAVPRKPDEGQIWQTVRHADHAAQEAETRAQRAAGGDARRIRRIGYEPSIGSGS